MRNQLATLSFVLMAIGCHAETSQEMQTIEIPMTQLEARLNAALAIRSDSTRDKAVAKVATDAAVGGELAVVLEAIQAMGDVGKSDNLCIECQKTFAKVGDIASATEVAKLIRDDSRRDRVLSELASNEENE